MSLARADLMSTGKRKVPDWVGAHPDQAIPQRVRLRVLDRFGSICQESGREIRSGDAWDCDHEIALSNGGEHAEANLRPVLRDSVGHKSKTVRDMKLKTKIERIRKKHMGIKAPSSFSNSRGGKFKTKVGGKTMPRG